MRFIPITQVNFILVLKDPPSRRLGEYAYFVRSLTMVLYTVNVQYTYTSYSTILYVLLSHTVRRGKLYL